MFPLIEKAIPPVSLNCPGPNPPLPNDRTSEPVGVNSWTWFAMGSDTSRLPSEAMAIRVGELATGIERTNVGAASARGAQRARQSGSSSQRTFVGIEHLRW